MSNSPEHYLQEIGRAGRDGRRAIAIALPLVEEVPVRHSLAHSNFVSKIQIRAILRKIRVLVNAAVEASGGNRDLHIALPVHATVRGCDCRQETIETFLSLIEIGRDKNPLLHVEGFNYDEATIALKKRTLRKLAEREEVALSIQSVCSCIDAPLLDKESETQNANPMKDPSSFQRQFLAYSMGSYTFSVTQCANKLGHSAEPRHVFAALRRLQHANELELALDTSEKGRVFHLKITKAGVSAFVGESYDELEETLTNQIYDSFLSSSRSGTNKVLDMHYILEKVSRASGNSDKNETRDNEKSISLDTFQGLIRDYFENGFDDERQHLRSHILPKEFSTVRDEDIQIDTYALLRDLPSIHDDQSIEKYGCSLLSGDSDSSDYTAVAITKFLHGIETPRIPFLVFRNHPFYGKWRHVDFGIVLESVQNILGSLAK
jgi:ATP-dependent DNA helicase Q4